MQSQFDLNGGWTGGKMCFLNFLTSMKKVEHYTPSLATVFPSNNCLDKKQLNELKKGITSRLAADKPKREKKKVLHSFTGGGGRKFSDKQKKNKGAGPLVQTLRGPEKFSDKQQKKRRKKRRQRKGPYFPSAYPPNHKPQRGPEKIESTRGDTSDRGCQQGGRGPGGQKASPFCNCSYEELLFSTFFYGGIPLPTPPLAARLEILGVFTLSGTQERPLPKFYHKLMLNSVNVFLFQECIVKLAGPYVEKIVKFRDALNLSQTPHSPTTAIAYFDKNKENAHMLPPERKKRVCRWKLIYM